MEAVIFAIFGYIIIAGVYKAYSWAAYKLVWAPRERRIKAAQQIKRTNIFGRRI